MGEIRKEVLRLALPVTFSHFLQRSSGLINVFFVGRLGAEELAALGIGQLLIFLMLTPIWGLAIGASATLAQLRGGGRREEAARTAFQTAFGALALALPLGLLGLLGSRPLALFLGAEAEVVRLLFPYVTVACPAFPLTALLAVLVNSVYGIGDPRAALLAMGVVNAVHLIAASLLIPALGLQGAALATALSEGVGVLVLWRIGKRRGYWARLPRFPSHLPTVGRLGLPVAFNRFLLYAGMVLYEKMILLYGTAVYATHQIGVHVESLSFIPGLGFGIAAFTLVGQSVGGGDMEKARLSNFEANRLACLFMGGMGLLFFAFPTFFFRLFTEEATVIRLGRLYMPIAGLSQIPLALSLVLAGSLRGAGDTRFVLGVNLVGVGLVRLPFSYFAYSLGFGPSSVWWAFLLDWSIRAVFFFLRFSSTRWEVVKV